MKFVYPEQLPISAAKAEIVEAVTSSQVVIVSGQTGSGKTTQIPKMLLEMGRGTHGKQIVHTQPRRIAARTVAERICQEMGVRLGDEVGYQVRFTDQSSPHTRLRVVTDGILLAQIQRDPHLSAYDTIIIDEAHERSLNIDFLLGYLTQLLRSRRDLKLVITSATIDSQKFQSHFSKALGHKVPIIEVSGRTYPVAIYYEPAGSAPALRPVTGFSDDDTLNDPSSAVARACMELLAVSKRERGARDILVFTSGERDIRDFETAIRRALGPSATDMRRPDAVEILPLFARLSSKDQHRVFDNHSHQRIILATNVAETSLTVPGIRYVVDPGTARISRYSKSAKVQRLPIEAISQASADQRAGRTGRVADGIAIRLYSKEDYDSRPRFTDPEILRTSLGAVVLHMLSVGVAHTAEDVTHFGFIDPPDTRSVSDGINELNELGAIKRARAHMDLTSVGRQLARLPIDVRLGRMIIEAHRSADEKTVACILVIVSFLSLQDPRERPEEKRDEADTIHRRYVDETSDFLTILNIWDTLFQADGTLSNSALRRRCQAEFLNYMRVRQWHDLFGQLVQMCHELHFKVGTPEPSSRQDLAVRQLPMNQQAAHSLIATWDSETIHRSMMAGLLSNLGMQVVREPKASDFAGLSGPARARAIKRAKKQSRNDYQGARGTHFAIFPASGLSKSTPPWVMATDLMETSRLWARMAASINPEWAEKLAGDLTKTVYSEPHWSAARGSAVASAKVLLYGLPIVAERQVQWGRINPAQAREFLIRQGLVEGDIHQRFSHDDFIAANRSILDESLEDTKRTRHVTQAVNDEDLFQFYDAVIPQAATSLAALANWWKKNRDADPHLFDFDPSSLERIDDAEHASLDDYPSTWKTRGTDGSDIDLKLTYRYEPGSPDDGITVHVPLHYLMRLSATEFTWLVPGFRDELILGIIRSLPKSLRVQFVPAPDTAAAIGEWIDAHTEFVPGIERQADGSDTGAGDGGTGAGTRAGSGTAAPVTSFMEVFTQAAIATRGAQLHPDLFDAQQMGRLPDHLRVTFSVEQDQGSQPEHASKSGRSHGRRPKKTGPAQVLASSKSLVELQNQLEDRAMKAARSSVGKKAKAAKEQGNPLKSATLLHQAGASTQSRDEMLWQVAYDKLKLPPARVTSRWLSREALVLASAPYKDRDGLVADLQMAAVKRLLPTIDTLTSDDDLALACAQNEDRFEDTVYAVAKDVVIILSKYGEVENAVSGTAQLPLLAVLQSIRDHLAGLVHPGFITSTPPDFLADIPRYIAADEVRLSKAKVDKTRDVKWAWEAHEAEQLVESTKTSYENTPAGPTHDEARTRAEQVRWMYEEYLVSLWAQELGTKFPISIQRLRKAAEG
jgi:ATP-dependent helicase HrpA